MCDKLTVYKIRGHAPTYQGTWYLNTNVPDKQRLEINKEIAELRRDNIVKKINSKFLEELVPQTCGKEATPEIDGDVLGRLLAILIGPTVFVIVAALVVGSVLKRRSSRGEQEINNSI